MKLVFCIDDGAGLAFNKRRQSRDKRLIEDLAELVGDEALYLSPYSEELFSEASLNIILTDSPLSAEQGDYVFLEKCDPAALITEAEELIIYKWNRRYPASIKLSKTPAEMGFSLLESVDFAGNSHEKITRERYIRKK